MITFLFNVFIFLFRQLSLLTTYWVVASDRLLVCVGVLADVLVFPLRVPVSANASLVMEVHVAVNAKMGTGEHRWITAGVSIQL